MYNPYLISPDSFWVGQKTTELLKSTYRYVPVHTCMYKLGILVLACTVLYWYVLVRTSTYHFVKSCPGVQDSRCRYIPGMYQVHVFPGPVTEVYTRSIPGIYLLIAFQICFVPLNRFAESIASQWNTKMSFNRIY